MSAAEEGARGRRQVDHALVAVSLREPRASRHEQGERVVGVTAGAPAAAARPLDPAERRRRDGLKPRGRRLAPADEQVGQQSQGRCVRPDDALGGIDPGHALRPVLVAETEQPLGDLPTELVRFRRVDDPITLPAAEVEPDLTVMVARDDERLRLAPVDTGDARSRHDRPRERRPEGAGDHSTRRRRHSGAQTPERDAGRSLRGHRALDHGREHLAQEVGPARVGLHARRCNHDQVGVLGQRAQYAVELAIDRVVHVRQRRQQQRALRLVERVLVELRQIPELVTADVRREEGQPDEVERLLAEQPDGRVAEPARRLSEATAERKQTREPRLAEDLVRVGAAAGEPPDGSPGVARAKPSVRAPGS